MFRYNVFYIYYNDWSRFIKSQNFRGDLNPQLSRSPRRDLFLFPDDELASPVEEHFPPEDTGVQLANPGESDDDEEDSDDDFCILEHPDKEPEGLSHEVIIKCLTDEQVNIVENHFTVPVSIKFITIILKVFLVSALYEGLLRFSTNGKPEQLHLWNTKIYFEEIIFSKSTAI